MKIREEWVKYPSQYNMIISIAAVDSKNAIGKDGSLLAHIKADMAHFKKNTQGNTVVMGRKTLESLPSKKPLPNRRNIVLTRNKSFRVDGAEIANSIDELMQLIKDEPNDVFIMGGGQIYKAMLPYCERLILTEIDKDFNGEVFYPTLDLHQWKKTFLSDPQTEGDITFRFVQYDRIDD